MRFVSDVRCFSHLVADAVLVCSWDLCGAVCGICVVLFVEVCAIGLLRCCDLVCRILCGLFVSLLLLCDWFVLLMCLLFVFCVV